MPASPTRPTYARADLPRLAKLDRAAILDAFGSFDDKGMDDATFALRAAMLFDAQRAPGLAEAFAAGDAAAVARAVYAACAAWASSRPRDTPMQDAKRQADELLDNRFTFYDESHQLPAEIDWDFNPGTAHWGHDLNRFSYLRPLTGAWQSTGDKRYARKAAELMLDWVAKADIGQAFVGTPYVFGSYLNNAIHCKMWAACVSQLLRGDVLEPIELLRICKSMHDQLCYLEIVTNGHAGNWPTIGCMGMLGVLEHLPVLRDTPRFADHCIHTMDVQIKAQILPDGAQMELTPHYHRVVISNLISASRSLRALELTLTADTLRRMKQAVQYAQQTVTPDGSATVAFNDSDPASVASFEPALAELGYGDFPRKPAELGPELFPYAGVALLRQRATEGDLYLAFDAGPFGSGHQHEDMLGFWLHALGRNFLVDPGRHLYDGSEKSFLAHLRSTAAHSTITIDGQDQNARQRRDTWVAKEPCPIDWHADDAEVRAAAQYDLGFGQNNAINVVHRREIVFVRQRFWLIFDRITGEGRHRIDLRFQYAPPAGSVTLHGQTATTNFDDANLLLSTLGTQAIDEATVAAGQRDPRRGWYSPSYGHIEPAPNLCMTSTCELPWRAATLLLPYRGREAPGVTFDFDGQDATITLADVGRLTVRTTL